MKKGLIGMLSACFMIFCFLGNAKAAEYVGEQQAVKQQEPSIDGKWIGDGEDWQYCLKDGSYLKKNWLYDGGKWYYFSSSGYIVFGNQKINGKSYYFNENGEMEIGWVFDEDEEKWYYLTENGTKQTGWYHAGDVWYWFDSKGVMFNRGFRMIDSHKYYFFENGQMAENQYVGTAFYGENGLREQKYDMVIQGKRRPDKEEKDQITKEMAGIPGKWIKKFIDSGWEFMYYTDKSYFSAPKTDQGIYYIYHKTDANYKKLKFTKPESLTEAFGEYIACVTGNNKEENGFMIEFQQYLEETSFSHPLPSYFNDEIAAWFGILFKCYCEPEGRYDLKKKNLTLYRFMKETLELDSEKLKPTETELLEQPDEEEEFYSNGNGPANDVSLINKKGPASEYKK